ncbi:MAG: type II secretion system GspH family protein [Chthoniobacter sp.]|nr:type II secretion system GspH family protein [Chthoniobacter sp.]
MKLTKSTESAFTLIELLVVISIIAILAGIALPVFGAAQTNAAQTKGLSNGKQIGTALRLYAGQNDGLYPVYGLSKGKPDPAKSLSDSNTAFAQLIPDQLPNEDVFWQSKSPWCNKVAPDNQIDRDSPDSPVETLKAGENEWAYVVGLNDTSNPTFPLLANGFVQGGETSHKYSVVASEKGGVWKGKNAIVIRCDGSGAILKVNGKDLTVNGPNGGTSDGDIFTTANAATGWLGPDNKVLNPKPPL